MFIKFNMIRWKNLLSTGNDWITLPLNQNPTTLIIGKNGHGKSQFLDAICFVLFNKAFRKINKPQLVNSINKKGMLVEIAFTVGRHEYVVRRGVKPDLFEIYRDKELIPEDAETGDYQSYLENHILRTDYKTFTQITIVGKATFVPFMQLKPADRRVIVENLLESHVYGDMQELAKNDLKLLTEKQRGINEAINLTNVRIEGLQRLINEKNADNQAHIDSINQKTESIRSKIAELEADNVKEKAELETFKTKIENFTNGQFSPEKLEDAQRTLNQKIGVLENDIRVHSASIKKVDIENCPSCGQKMDENHKAHIMTESMSVIERSQSELEVCRERLGKVRTYLQQYNNLVEQARSIHSRISSNTSNIDFYTRAIADNERSIQELKEKKSVTDVDSSELEGLKQELSKAKDDLDKNANEIVIVKNCIKLLDDSGIKAHVVDKYIPLINEQINYYLERMNQFIQFELDNKFNETIKARYRDNYSYESFSEGEKLRINLAILLAWIYIARKRNSVTTNLIIFDETLDGSMDDEGVVDFLNIVRELNNSNIFLISHKTEIIEGIENTYRAKKVLNFTEMEKV